MAVTANIKFVQGMLTPPAGQALIGVAGVPVTASNEDSSNVETMTWEVIDVPPTSAVATGIAHFGAPQDFIFNPDQPGGYFIHLTVTDLAGNRADSYLVFQIAEPSGYIIPPFMATAPTLNFSGQTRGWAKYIEELLRFLLSGAPSVGLIWNVTSVNANYPVVAADIGINVDLTGGPVTVTLPATPTAGRVLVLWDQYGSAALNNLTIDGNGLIVAGALTLVLNEAYAGVILIFNGVDWNVVGKYPVGAGGGGGLSYAERGVLGGSTSTTNDSLSPLVLATMAIDPNVWPATIGILNRVVTLKATLYTDNVAAAPVVSMEDLPGAVTVGTIAPAASLTPGEYNTVLTVGSFPGMIRDDVVHVYEWRLYRSGGTVADTVFVGNVRIDVTYV